MSEGLVSLVSGIQKMNVGSQVATAVLKQTMDQEEAFAQALVQMINDGPSVSGLGSVVDVRA